MNPTAATSDSKVGQLTTAKDSKTLFNIDQIKKSFDDGFELAIENLNIPLGNVVSLLGPTGSGKTTLLRIIAGLEQLNEGKISFGGTELADAIESNNKRIVMVHQSVLLIRGTVEQNIQYGLKLRNDAEVISKTEGIIERFGLTNIAKQSVNSLSKGQKTLVGLARSFVLQPEVLLLDEPTSSLDPARVQLVENEIRKLQEECQTTIVVATHNLFQAKRIANQTALILGGRLIEASETGAFFKSPNQQITKDFLEGKIVF